MSTCLGRVMSMAIAAVVGCGTPVNPDRACETPYQCPSGDVVDCMPVVPPAQAELCSGPCADWIRENCDIEYVH